VESLWHPRCGINFDFYYFSYSPSFGGQIATLRTIVKNTATRLTMRHDEVNQEADDHHRSCSCPCSRHRSTEAPSCLKHRVSCSRHCCGSTSCCFRGAEEPHAAVRGATRFLLLFTVKRHRQEQEALRHCFGASVIWCFGASVIWCFGDWCLGASNRGKSKSGGGCRPLG
jgi:hypothetical protein